MLQRVCFLSQFVLYVTIIHWTLYVNLPYLIIQLFYNLWPPGYELYGFLDHTLKSPALENTLFCVNIFFKNKDLSIIINSEKMITVGQNISVHYFSFQNDMFYGYILFRYLILRSDCRIRRLSKPVWHANKCNIFVIIKWWQTSQIPEFDNWSQDNYFQSEVTIAKKHLSLPEFSIHCKKYSLFGFKFKSLIRLKLQ